MFRPPLLSPDKIFFLEAKWELLPNSSVKTKKLKKKKKKSKKTKFKLEKNSKQTNKNKTEFQNGTISLFLLLPTHFLLLSSTSGWYGRKRIQCSRAGYLKKTHRGCISERFKNKSAMPVFNRNQMKSKNK